MSTEWLKANLRHRAKTFLGRHPRLYRWVFQGREGYRDRMVTEATDICIDGYPRSANSFAVGAFEQAQDGPVRIAHHNHAPAPILEAVRREIPAVVLIRNPVDTLISERGLQLQTAAVEGRPPPLHVSYATRLRGWMSFYERLDPVLDDVVVAPFELVTEDVGEVIDAVNTRFDTTFSRFEHTDANVRRIRDTRGYHALPSDEREALKAQARRRFERDLGDAPLLVRQARNLHNNYLRHANTAPRSVTPSTTRRS